jgi:hypothetical protein
MPMRKSPGSPPWRRSPRRHHAQEGNPKVSAAIYEELLASSQPLYVRRAALEGLLRTDADGGEKRCLTVIRGTEADLKPSALFHVRTIRNPKMLPGFRRRVIPFDNR